MSKTIVNIITPQDPLPAYLFIKELYESGDRLMFVSTRNDEEKIDFFTQLIGIAPSEITDVVLQRHEDSFTYERICRRLRALLHADESYYVNLAGGSRYMALAVHQAFTPFHSRFFYTQTRENIIVSSIFDDSIYDNDDIFTPITYRMTLAEYFEAHGLRHDLQRHHSHIPIRDSESTQRIFDLYAHNKLSDDEFESLNVLRTQFRGEQRPCKISFIERNGAKRLSSLLFHIGFVPAVSGQLSHDEIDYLTGGWFEEWVFNLIIDRVEPDDIAIGVRIWRPGEQHNNELDVCFIKGNALHVIECKTGIQSDHLFNEIVYKACALREALLGMTAQSSIFSLKRDPDGNLERVARIMDIRLLSRHILTSPKLLEKSLRVI